MNQNDFRTITDGQLKLCQAVLEAKGNEYAEDSDVFANFRRAGALQYSSVKEALAGMMVKHTVVLYDMLAAVEDFPQEIWIEKITDHINYLLILRAMVAEEAPKEDNESSGEPQLPFPTTDSDTYQTPIYHETAYPSYDKV